MLKLNRKDWLVLVGIALAGVEVVVGVLVSHTVALVLLPIFIGLLVFAYYKAVRTKEDITSSDVREFQCIVERRRMYLPQLQEALEALLNKQYELTDKAGKLSLEDYRDKFLKLSLKYKVIKAMTSGTVGKLVRKLTMKDEREVILMALRQENFIHNNLYIRELEQGEDYQTAWREYNKWRSQTPEGDIRSSIDRLMKMEKRLGSISSMAQVSRREITKSPTILAGLYKCESVLRTIVESLHKEVNDKFRELLGDGK